VTPVPASPSLSRRSLLKAVTATGTVLVAGQLGLDRVFGQDSIAAAMPINAWVAVASDGAVTLQCAHSEMGQGIMTTFAAVIADELDADWNKVRVEFSPAALPFRHPLYNWQFTGNSESIRSYHALIRKMGSAARAMLIAAAAESLGAPVAELTTRNGTVHHAASGRSIGYGEVATAAAAKPVPQDPHVKPQAEWQLVGHGRSLMRLDVPAKVDGSAIFGIDVKVPDMAHAAVISAPTIGGAVASVDDSDMRNRPGVIAVVPLGSAVAVVAEHYWQARLAVEALSVAWTDGPGGAFGDQELDDMYRAAMAGDAWAVAEEHGDARGVLNGSPRMIEAEYWSPWQAHAPMEPMNATVSVTAEGATVWAPTQGPQMAQVVLASVLGIDPESVTVHRTYLGGGFGRRLLADYIAQAAICAKAVGRPVKLIWHREEDFKQDVYRPGFLHHVRAVTDEEGLPLALHQRLVAPTILGPVSPTPLQAGDVDALAVEGARELTYAIPNNHVDYHMLQVPVPTMVWRTTGYGPNTFAVESFIDELASLAGENPYQYRRRLLAGNTAATAVLDRTATLANWGRSDTGRFQGIAFADCFGSYLCQVVELSLVDDAVKLHKVTSVVDPGRVLDRINAASNIEGGVIWGLTAALYSEITFEHGHVREQNFDRFTIASLPDTPEMVTDFLEQRAELGGIGEVGPVCVAPALANALFAATGVRHRRLPLSRAGVRTVYGKQFA
jgi:isoquinoline 1-oxidoreductase beta subunit